MIYMYRIFSFMFNNTNIFSQLFSNILLDSTINQVLSNDSGNQRVQEVSYNIELKDCGEYYLIKGYLPEISARDVRIDFQKNIVTLTIRKNQTYYNDRNTMTTSIQTSENFVKTFPVDEIDKDNIGAAFEKDILLLTLPKKKYIDEYNKDTAMIVDVDNYTDE